MDALSLNKINVLCDIPHLEILEIECRERINEHAYFHVKMAISPKTLEWFDRHSLCDKQLRIQLGEAQTGQLAGDIVSAQWGTVDSEPYVDIQAFSGTKRMDRVRKKCFFQQMGMTYGALLKRISNCYQGTALIIDEKERKMEYPIAQYDETDWELINRIAAQLDTVIMTDSKTKYPRFSLGCVREKIYEIDVPLTVEKILSQGDNGYRITSWENLPLGAKIRMYGETVTVIDKTVALKNGLIEFTYAMTQRIHNKNQKENEKLRGVSARGTIMEVQGERIKLDIGMDDKLKIEQLYAYRYLPVTGNAMYAMPEEGAEAELYMPTPDMKDAYIRNCFLAKTEYPDEAVKFMASPRQKMLEMLPDGSSWENVSDRGLQSMSIKRTSGLTFLSSSKVSLIAGKDIILNAKTSCKIDTAEEIELKQTDTANSILMSGNTIRMSAESYEVSSDSPAGERKRSVEMDFVMTEANQSVLAAIPMNTCDALALQMAAAVPQILSADSFKNTGAGCLRRYWRG